MDRIEQQILNHLALHAEGLPGQALQSVIRPSLSQPSLWRRLDKLRTAGRIRALGRGRATRYVIQGSDHTLSDLRSKALHLEVGRKLIRRPELLEHARQRLMRLYKSTPYSSAYLDRWNELLAGPLEGVLQILAADDEDAKALRHVSPFVGILNETERLKILRKQGLMP